MLIIEVTMKVTIMPILVILILFSSCKPAVELVSDTVATPKFAQPSGSIFNSATYIRISCSTENAKVYYTVDGSVPTQKSTMYTAPILLLGQDKTLNITAKAFRGGLKESGTNAATYTIHYEFPSDGTLQVEPVSISVQSGVYPREPNKFTAELGCDTPGADIYYTVVRDGLIPTLNWDRMAKVYTNEETMTRLYSEPFEVEVYNSETPESIQWQNKVKAFAIKDGMTPSSMTQAHYTTHGWPQADPLEPNIISSSIADDQFQLFTLTVRDDKGWRDIDQVRLSIRVTGHGTTNPALSREMIYFRAHPAKPDALIIDNDNHVDQPAVYYNGPYGVQEIVEMPYYYVDIAQCTMTTETGDSDGNGIAEDSVTFTFAVKPKLSVIDPDSELGDLSKVKRLWCWINAMNYVIDPETGEPLVDTEDADGDGDTEEYVTEQRPVVSEVGRWDIRE